jgi:hypothetical protein
MANAQIATTPQNIPVFSYHECIQKLALLIEQGDDSNLDKIVALIARLAIPITGAWN